MIILKTSGVDYSAENVGFYGEHLPAFGGSLAWAGAFGNGWEQGNAHDFSMNERPGVVVGAPAMFTGYASVGVGNYIEAPLTDSGLIASGTGNQFSLVAVVVGLPSSGVSAVISTLGTSAQSGFRFGKASGAGSVTFLADKGLETQSSITGPTTATAAASPEFMAVTVNGLNVVIYRRGASDTALLSSSGTLSLTGIEGRGVGWRIGNSYSGTPPSIGAGLAGFYNSALTSTQMGQVFARAQQRMALRGIPI